MQAALASMIVFLPPFALGFVARLATPWRPFLVALGIALAVTGVWVLVAPIILMAGIGYLTMIYGGATVFALVGGGLAALVLQRREARRSPQEKPE